MFSVTILQVLNPSKDSLRATHRVLHMFTSFEQLVSLSGRVPANSPWYERAGCAGTRISDNCG